MSESGVERFNSGKLKKLKEMGLGFLARCASLVRVDLSGLTRIVPKKITANDVKAAEEEVVDANSKAHAHYKQAWSVSEEADRL
jgi:hypothetical protein